MPSKAYLMVRSVPTESGRVSNHVRGKMQRNSCPASERGPVGRDDEHLMRIGGLRGSPGPVFRSLLALAVMGRVVYLTETMISIVGAGRQPGGICRDR